MYKEQRMFAEGFLEGVTVELNLEMQVGFSKDLTCPPIFRRFMFLHRKVFPPYFFCRLKENSSKFYGFTLFFTEYKFSSQPGLL